jgi:hypothetical protein
MRSHNRSPCERWWLDRAGEVRASRSVALVISLLPIAVNTLIGYITRMAVNPETTARKLISLPHALVKDVQDYRYDNRLPSEAVAFRRLIRLGLGAEPILAEVLAFLERNGDVTDAETRATIMRLRNMVRAE